MSSKERNSFSNQRFKTLANYNHNEKVNLSKNFLSVLNWILWCYAFIELHNLLKCFFGCFYPIPSGIIPSGGGGFAKFSQQSKQIEIVFLKTQKKVCIYFAYLIY
jgi:hypothetical protein